MIKHNANIVLPIIIFLTISVCSTITFAESIGDKIFPAHDWPQYPNFDWPTHDVPDYSSPDYDVPSFSDSDLDVNVDDVDSSVMMDTDNSIVDGSGNVYDPLINNTSIMNTVLLSNSISYTALRNSSSASDRIDDLVNGDSISSSGDGGWASMGGSKIGKSGSFKNDGVYYEVGYDQLTKNIDSEKQFTGISLSYARGNIKYNNKYGNGKERDEIIAIYRLSRYAHGQYLSFVGSIGQYCNSYDLIDYDNNRESAKNKSYGFTASTAYGFKKRYENGWYVDPHAQITLAYLAGNSYYISNGVDVRNAGVPSLVGRVGLNVGRSFGWRNSTTVYLKCNWSHEFMGNYKVDTIYNETGSKITTSGNCRESWFEFVAGFSYRLADNNFICVSVGRSTGGSCYRDLVWNVGFKWSF